MKQIISIILLLCMSNLNIMAQADSTYIGKFYNQEHKIFLKIDLVNKNIVVDDQTVFGEMDGYIGSDQCNHIWAIVSSEIINGKVEIEVVNNYGSEDFQATLTKDKDNNLIFKHTEGSVLKFPVNRKWQKIPSKILFVRQKQ